jgi:hydroxymethylbilane synthase
MKTIRIATRKSPLAMKQTELVCKAIQEVYPEVHCEWVLITTTGDARQQWSLSEQGGKGLFTKEIEDALLSGEADLAVHSAKDLPTLNPEGLEIAGFLPREDPRDVLVMREGLQDGYPRDIASASPRRRIQGKVIFPNAVWCEIRGNLDTRLKKVAGGSADATFLAAAGLNRLEISEWPGLTFRRLPFKVMVPAVGQAAIALQARKGDQLPLAGVCCAITGKAVRLERAMLRCMDGGCQIAMGAHFDGTRFHLFHEEWGYRLCEVPESAHLDADAYCTALIASFAVHH